MFLVRFPTKLPSFKANGAKLRKIIGVGKSTPHEAYLPDPPHDRVKKALENLVSSEIEIQPHPKTDRGEHWNMRLEYEH